MDFRWASEEEEFFHNIVRFSQTELLSSAGSDPRVSFKERWQKCGRMGLLGLSVPEEFGGLGLGALRTAHAMEAFGYGCSDSGLVFSVAAHLFACVMPIVEGASDALKSEVLPKLASGEWVGANAISEAEAGSDVFSLKSTAVKDGDFYILNGTKTYVTNGPASDLILFYASTNPRHGYLGISAFLVEPSQPGVVVGKPFETMGLETSPIGSIYLDGCKVSKTRRVGNEGGGAALFSRSMIWERACLFGFYIGAMQRHLEKAIAHAKTRKQFKKTIGSFQAISHKIADMKVRLDSVRWLLYHACWKMDQGANPTAEVAMAKLAISEAVTQSALELIQIHGGYGYMTESSIEQELRNAVPAKIFSGTSEIQRDLIARSLGL